MTPSTHVHGLFLNPHVLFGSGVAGHDLAHSLGMEGIELFDADNGDGYLVALLPFCDEIVVDAPRAEEELADFFRRMWVVENLLKGPLDKVLQWTDAIRMPQKSLRRKDNERLARLTQHLSSQEMKELSGKRRISNLHI